MRASLFVAFLLLCGLALTAGQRCRPGGGGGFMELHSAIQELSPAAEELAPQYTFGVLLESEVDVETEVDSEAEMELADADPTMNDNSAPAVLKQRCWLGPQNDKMCCQSCTVAQRDSIKKSFSASGKAGSEFYGTKLNGAHLCVAQMNGRERIYYAQNCASEPAPNDYTHRCARIGDPVTGVRRCCAKCTQAQVDAMLRVIQGGDFNKEKGVLGPYVDAVNRDNPGQKLTLATLQSSLTSAMFKGAVKCVTCRKFDYYNPKTKKEETAYLQWNCGSQCDCNALTDASSAELKKTCGGTYLPAGSSRIHAVRGPTAKAPSSAPGAKPKAPKTSRGGSKGSAPRKTCKDNTGKTIPCPKKTTSKQGTLTPK